MFQHRCKPTATIGMSKTQRNTLENDRSSFPFGTIPVLLSQASQYRREKSLKKQVYRPPREEVLWILQHPIYRYPLGTTTVPTCSTADCSGMVLFVPSSLNLPDRGPRIRTPTKAARPPVTWTTPDPAKSITPQPYSGSSVRGLAQPPSDHAQCATTGSARED